MIRRAGIAALTLSAAALVGLVAHEGYSGRAIVPVPGDVPTIGFGTTAGVRLGDTIDPVRALQRAMVDVGRFEGALKQCVSVPLHQHEYDAYVSLAYNIGPQAFCGSTLVRRLNALDYAGACAEIRRWTWFNGRNCAAPGSGCAGLAARREAEYAQCVGAALAAKSIAAKAAPTGGM